MPKYYIHIEYDVPTTASNHKQASAIFERTLKKMYEVFDTKKFLIDGIFSDCSIDEHDDEEEEAPAGG
jgi:hypothetical protein